MSNNTSIRDIDIRQHLHENTLAQRFKPSDTRIINEMGILWGEARIDIAVINCALHAFEIKSEVDTLNRLEKQYSEYRKVFDYLNIVIHESKLNTLNKNYRKTIQNWGIYVVHGDKTNLKIDLKEKAVKNNNTDILSVCHLLWKNEAIELLKSIQITKGISSMDKRTLYNTLIQHYKKEELTEKIRGTLKKRASWKVG